MELWIQHIGRLTYTNGAVDAAYRQVRSCVGGALCGQITWPQQTLKYNTRDLYTGLFAPNVRLSLKPTLTCIAGNGTEQEYKTHREMESDSRRHSSLTPTVHADSLPCLTRDNGWEDKGWEDHGKKEEGIEEEGSEDEVMED